MGIQFWASRLTLMCFLLSTMVLFSQNTDNPFELKERFKEVGESSSEATEKEDTETIDYSNPLEVKHGVKKSEGVSFQFPAIEDLPEVETTGPVSHLFVGIIFLLVFLLIAFLNTAYSNELQHVLKAFSNDNILKLQLRQNNATVKLSSALLYLIYIITIGTFFFYAGNYYSLMPDGIWMLLLCIVSTGILTAGRFLVLSLISNIFPFHKEIKHYAYTITIFDFVIGLILVPVVLFFAFSPESISEYFMYIGLAILLLAYIYRSLRGLKIANKYIMQHKFHFFLYLCTVEIAPMVLLIKLIVSWGTII